MSDAFADLGYTRDHQPTFPCELCSGSGEVLAFLKSDHSAFAFKCTCAAGDLCTKKRWPLWPGFGAGYALTR